MEVFLGGVLVGLAIGVWLLHNQRQHVIELRQQRNEAYERVEAAHNNCDRIIADCRASMRRLDGVVEAVVTDHRRYMAGGRKRIGRN